MRMDTFVVDGNEVKIVTPTSVQWELGVIANIFVSVKEEVWHSVQENIPSVVVPPHIHVTLRESIRRDGKLYLRANDDFHPLFSYVKLELQDSIMDVIKPWLTPAERGD